jgi:thymidine kinase
MSGKLELIIGPMCSGKSSELIRRIRLFNIINKKVLVIKPQIDTRYIDNKITSHNFESVDCITLNKLNDLNYDKTIDVIIIDEGQFFNDLKSTILNWLNKYNIHIIVAGLDGDFERNPIGEILALIPHAEKCYKINSLCGICKDGTDACFTFRKAESKNVILIGGTDIYIPVCRKHYTELNK